MDLGLVESSQLGTEHGTCHIQCVCRPGLPQNNNLHPRKPRLSSPMRAKSSRVSKPKTKRQTQTETETLTAFGYQSIRTHDQQRQSPLPAMSQRSVTSNALRRSSCAGEQTRNMETVWSEGAERGGSQGQTQDTSINSRWLRSKGLM